MKKVFFKDYKNFLQLNKILIYIIITLYYKCPQNPLKKENELYVFVRNMQQIKEKVFIIEFKMMNLKINIQQILKIWRLKNIEKKMKIILMNRLPFMKH